MKTKRILAVVLAFAMLMTFIPGITLTASAAEPGTDGESLTIDKIELSYQDNGDGTVNTESIWVDVSYTATGVTTFSVMLTPVGGNFLNALYIGQENSPLDGNFGFAVTKSLFTEGTEYTLQLTATQTTRATENFEYAEPEAPESDGEYSGGTGTKEDPYILSTPEDLIAFNTAISNDYGSLDAADDCGLGVYHGYYFELSNDIDMNGIPWTPVSFCGNLDGNGYAIKNLSVTEADNGDGEYWAAMFAQLINATVSDIVFENCRASISSETSSSRDVYVAIVAANAIASKLENIKVIDSDIIQNGYAKNMGYAAYVAALADITHITGCVVKGGTITVNTPDTNPMNVGGITGCLEDLFYEYIAYYENPYNMEIGKGAGYGIYNCYVNADIFVNAGAASHTAGIVGMTCTDYLDDTEEYNGVAVEIKNCLYEGVITAVKGTASGISGWDEPEDVISDCVSLATLSGTRTFALCELPETVTNSYYLADEADENGGRTAEQFADCSVCDLRGGHYIVEGSCAIAGYTPPVLSIITASATPTEGGTVTATVDGNATTTVRAETEVTLTVSTNDGYELESLTLNGEDVTAQVSEGKYIFEIPAGDVTITATFKKVIVYGDVNCDGTFNALDHATFARYYSLWEGYETIANVAAADVNADGYANSMDRIIMARNLAKWDGYETFPYTK